MLTSYIRLMAADYLEGMATFWLKPAHVLTRTHSLRPPALIVQHWHRVACIHPSQSFRIVFWLSQWRIITLRALIPLPGFTLCFRKTQHEQRCKQKGFLTSVIKLRACSGMYDLKGHHALPTCHTRSAMLSGVFASPAALKQPLLPFIPTSPPISYKNKVRISMKQPAAGAFRASAGTSTKPESHA